MSDAVCVSLLAEDTEKWRRRVLQSGDCSRELVKKAAERCKKSTREKKYIERRP